MPTIVDVARRAGVSWNTVSRVINGDLSVRPETREVVLQAIRELDYVPNAAARSLKNSRTRTIGLIVSFLRDAVFHPITAGIEAVVRDHGYSLLICDSNLDPRTEAVNLETLYQKHVEGLIFYPVGDRCPSLERFQRARIPVLVMDWSEPTPGLPQLPLKHRAVLREAIEYLLGLGHQRIAFVGAISRFGRWRAEEFRQIWRELNLPLDPSLMARVIDQQEAADALRIMLNRPNRPTAVISTSLYMTSGILRAINTTQLDIPRDISFITYGDTELTECYRPPLTVMVTDRLTRGRVAAEYIFARLAGEEASGMLREWDVNLVLRASCSVAPNLGPSNG